MEPVINDGETFYPVRLYSVVDSLDYETGTTYNLDTDTKPAGLNKTDNNVYYSGAASEPSPEIYSSGLFSKTNYGLCWKSVKKNPGVGKSYDAYSKQAQYMYTDNTGTSFYYYIQYNYPKK